MGLKLSKIDKNILNFRVVNVDIEGNINSKGKLVFVQNKVKFYRKHRLASDWSLEHLRRFCLDNTCDSIILEFQSGNPSFRGIFAFRSKDAKRIFDLLKEHTTAIANQRDAQNTTSSMELQGGSQMLSETYRTTESNTSYTRPRRFSEPGNLRRQAMSEGYQNIQRGRFYVNEVNETEIHSGRSQIPSIVIGSMGSDSVFEPEENSDSENSLSIPPSNANANAREIITPLTYALLDHPPPSPTRNCQSGSSTCYAVIDTERTLAIAELKRHLSADPNERFWSHKLRDKNCFLVETIRPKSS